MILVHKVLDCVQVAIDTGQRDWRVTSLVSCIYTYTGILSVVAIDLPYNAYTSRITMMLIHKVLDCVQAAIGTGQKECGVTSIVDWLC